MVEALSFIFEGLLEMVVQCILLLYFHCLETTVSGPVLADDVGKTCVLFLQACLEVVDFLLAVQEFVDG